jgi:hypothetical protein
MSADLRWLAWYIPPERPLHPSDATPRQRGIEVAATAAESRRRGGSDVDDGQIALVRRFAAVALITTLAVAAVVAQQPRQRSATVPGWSISIVPGATKATSIEWQFGEDAKTLGTRIVSARDVMLQQPLRDARVLYLRAVTSPAGAQAAFCARWGALGSAYVEFVGTTERRLTSEMRDPRCVTIYRVEPERRLLELDKAE